MGVSNDPGRDFEEISKVLKLVELPLVIRQVGLVGASVRSEQRNEVRGSSEIGGEGKWTDNAVYMGVDAEGDRIAAWLCVDAGLDVARWWVKSGSTLMRTATPTSQYSRQRSRRCAQAAPIWKVAPGPSSVETLEMVAPTVPTSVSFDCIFRNCGWLRR